MGQGKKERRDRLDMESRERSDGEIPGRWRLGIDVEALERALDGVAEILVVGAPEVQETGDFDDLARGGMVLDGGVAKQTVL